MTSSIEYRCGPVTADLLASNTDATAVLEVQAVLPTFSSEHCEAQALPLNISVRHPETVSVELISTPRLDCANGAAAGGCVRHEFGYFSNQLMPAPEGFEWSPTPEEIVAAPDFLGCRFANDPPSVR